MRAREFIVEYRRDITANKIGLDRILDALGKTHINHLPNELLRNHARLIKSASSPKQLSWSGPSNKFFDVEITPDNVDLLYSANQIRMVNDILDFFEERDPTPNKTYVPWMVRAFINDPKFKLEDYNRDDLLTRYTRGKQAKIISGDRDATSGIRDNDINTFPTYKQFEDQILTKYRNQLYKDTKAMSRGDYEEVYEDADVRVVRVKDEKAACYYGQGTRWCTAATHGANYFDYYSSKGPLYILLPKDPSYDGEKYQIHFESRQYMNQNDQSVGLMHILDRFPGFTKWVRENSTVLDQMITYIPTSALEKIISKLNSLISDEISRMIQKMKKNKYYREWVGNFAIDHGYLDDYGNIQWSSVMVDPRVSITEYNKGAKVLYDIKKEIEEISAEGIKSMAEDYEKQHNDLIYIDEIEYLYRKFIEDITEEIPTTISELIDLYDWIRENIKVEPVKLSILPYEELARQMRGRGYSHIQDWWVGRSVE